MPLSELCREFVKNLSVIVVDDDVNCLSCPFPPESSSAESVAFFAGFVEIRVGTLSEVVGHRSWAGFLGAPLWGHFFAASFLVEDLHVLGSAAQSLGIAGAHLRDDIW